MTMYLVIDSNVFISHPADFPLFAWPEHSVRLEDVKESSVLNLPGWKVLALIESPGAYRVEAEYPPDFVYCLHCLRQNVYRHGWRLLVSNSFGMFNHPLA